MITYQNRTPKSIKAEYDSYDKEGVDKLATFLQMWMANEHNDRNFLLLVTEARKDKTPEHLIAKQVLQHALDWLAYGN